MRNRMLMSVLVCFSLLLVVTGAGCKGDESATPEPNESTTTSKTDETPTKPDKTDQSAQMQDSNQPAEPNTAGEVAVIVNGEKIMEGEIDAMIEPQLEQMAARMPNQNPAYLDQYRKMLRQQAVQQKIIEQLMNKKVAEKNITVSEEEIDAELQDIAESANLTLEQLKQRVAQSGQNFEDMKQQVRTFVSFQKLLEAEFPEKMQVTEDEAKAFFEENKDQFGQAEQVKASHILLKPDTSDPNTDPNEARAEARAKTEEVLQKLKDGADFAELAKETGGYPSASRGGDLGFFKRGAMVPAFDKVAFELQVGQISDIVETQFGYHVIKVTDKQQASEPSFEEVKDKVMAQLESRKQMETFKEYSEDLKENANIEYPPGKEPPQAPAPGPGGMPIQ